MSQVRILSPRPIFPPFLSLRRVPVYTPLYTTAKLWPGFWAGCPPIARVDIAALTSIARNVPERSGGKIDVELLVFWVMCGIATSMIFNSKGQDKLGGFFLGAVAGPFGILLALAQMRLQAMLRKDLMLRSTAARRDVWNLPKPCPPLFRSKQSGR